MFPQPSACMCVCPSVFAPNYKVFPQPSACMCVCPSVSAPNYKVCTVTLYFIYFTTITKQVIQLILIMLVGTDDCVQMVFMWEETGVPEEKPPV